ncbi:MAG: hypothetical protein FJZ00_00985 [Candidatus Sericytochromatia bacterium]|uniref:Uncharacterized protein n=1 Tax=Candidatus Tanganyikabacteria bacterium TaxID=2961651 RepID=A0A937X2P2_9BACT|nr:hypothetical protein [Candidatus Tanganyikabacteria bacterium]
MRTRLPGLFEGLAGGLQRRHVIARRGVRPDRTPDGFGLRADRVDLVLDVRDLLADVRGCRVSSQLLDGARQRAMLAVECGRILAIDAPGGTERRSRRQVEVLRSELQFGPGSGRGFGILGQNIGVGGRIQDGIAGRLAAFDGAPDLSDRDRRPGPGAALDGQGRPPGHLRPALATRLVVGRGRGKDPPPRLRCARILHRPALRPSCGVERLETVGQIFERFVRAVRGFAQYIRVFLPRFELGLEVRQGAREVRVDVSQPRDCPGKPLLEIVQARGQIAGERLELFAQGLGIDAGHRLFDGLDAPGDILGRREASRTQFGQRWHAISHGT